MGDRLKREGIYAFIRLIHNVVQQKLYRVSVLAETNTTLLSNNIPPKKPKTTANKQTKLINFPSYTLLLS